MPDQSAKEVNSFTSVLIVLWPAILWGCGFIVSLIARWNGCKISARGPEECLFLGADVGEFLYPLWSLGFFLIYVFLWVPIGLIILGIVRHIYKNSV